MKKRALAMTLSLCLLVGLLPTAALAAGGTLQGTGTETDPYLIEDVADLKKFRDNVNGGEDYEGKFVKLTGDTYDLSGETNWTPIGNGTRDGTGEETATAVPRLGLSYTGAAFKGTFDGGGNTITGLKINDTGEEKKTALGLFGVVDSGTVQNLKLANVNITSTNSNCVGGAIGLMVKGATADHIEVSGAVSGARGVGGIAGRMIIQGTISNCINEAAVTTVQWDAGGIVGTAAFTEKDKEMNITNCVNKGTITCFGYSGGIVGTSAANVTDCENSVDISGSYGCLGGIVGEQRRYGTVSGNTNTGNVTTTSKSEYGVGGIVGWVRYNDQDKDYGNTKMIRVTNNTNEGDIDGGYDGGGIIGVIYNTAVVTGNTNKAKSIDGSEFAAGIVGSLQNISGGNAFGDQPDILVENNVSTTDEKKITGKLTHLYAYNNEVANEKDPFKVVNNSDAWVAEVDGVQYATLAGAVAAVTAAAEDKPVTIKLLDNVQLDNVLEIKSGWDITLDLNGKTITELGAETRKILNHGTLTVKDTGTGGEIKNDTVGEVGQDGSYGLIDNYGKLTIESGKFTDVAHGNGSSLRNRPKGQLIINGGTFTNTADDTGTQTSNGWKGAANAFVYSDGDLLEINGGTFTMEKAQYTPAIKVVGNGSIKNVTITTYKSGGIEAAGGTVTIENASISVSDPHSYYANAIAVSGGGTVTVRGGSYTGYSYGAYVYNSGGTINIASGTFEAGTAVLKADTSEDAEADSVINVTGGNLTGAILTGGTSTTRQIIINITGGTFSADPGKYVPETHGVSVVEGKYVVGLLSEDNAAAKVGDRYYKTLVEAIGAAQDGQTVTVLRDMTSAADIDLSNLNKTVEIDLGGHTLTLADGKKIQITGSGSRLHLKNGKLNGNRTLMVLCYEGATVDLTGITGVNSKPEGTGEREYSNFLQVGSNADSNPANWSTGHATITDCDLTAGGNVVYILGKKAANTADPSTCTIVNSKLTGRAPVSGNGNCYANVTIKGGTLTARWPEHTEDIGAVYWPGAGTLTIEGGTFSGDTAVYAKSGTIEINGGTFIADGDQEYDDQGSGFIPTGDAIVLDSCGYPGGAPVLKITDGKFYSENKAAVARYTGNGSTVQAQVTIEGGTFSSDPKDYVPEGKVVVPGNYSADGKTYGYQVMEPVIKDVDVAITAGETKAEGTPDITVIGGSAITDETLKEDAAKIQATEGLAEQAAADLGTLTQGIDQEKAAEKLAEELGDNYKPEEDKITIVAEPYLEIQVKAYAEDKAEEVTTKTLTLDITPKCVIKATTGDPTKEENNGGMTATNTVPLKTVEKMEVTETVKLSVPLPTGFVESAETPVFVQHKDRYEYTATVTAGTEPNSFVAEFENPHGFSEFKLSTKSTAVAKVGNVGYPTFQEAVNAAGDGGTVEVVKNENLTATVSGSSRTITVKNGTDNPITVTLNGKSFEIGAGATETYTYTRPSSSGSSGSSTTTQTVTNPDGSKTTTVTDKKTGTVTETTKFKDGSTLVVVTEKDGTVTTTETRADKVEVKTVAAPDKAVTANVTLPKGVETATVTVPADVDYGVVAVNAKTGEIVKLSVPTEDGMLIKLDASADLVLEDRSKDFVDVPGHWAEDNIDFAVAHGMFNGTTETTFAPESPMTRAMLMTVLARFDGQSTDGGAAWFEKGMEWAKTNGVSDGTNPDGSITREQLATMLYRYAGSPAVDGKLGGFTDAGQVSGYAADAVAWAVSTGIIGGMGDGILAPQSNATRAQVATMLMRFVTNMVK